MSKSKKKGDAAEDVEDYSGGEKDKDKKKQIETEIISDNLRCSCLVDYQKFSDLLQICPLNGAKDNIVC